MQDNQLVYEFQYAGGHSHTYIFKTDFEIFYEIKFKEFDYFFSETKSYAKYTYEFVIGVLWNPNKKPLTFDSKISATIAAIVFDFFNKIEEPIILYICDSGDGRQMSRSRKFSSWFNEFQRPEFTKLDFVLHDKHNIQVPISMILKLSNPYFEEVIIDFKKIISEYHQK